MTSETNKIVNDSSNFAPQSQCDPRQIQESFQQIAKLARLHAKLSVVLAGTAPLAKIMQASCQHLVDSLEGAFARVWLVEEHEPVLQLVASAGMYEHLDGAHGRVPIGELKIGRIAAQKEALLTNDVQNDANIGDPQWASRERMVAFAGYPLVVEDRVVGVVALFARHALAPEVFEQLKPMADAFAQCIARKESEQALLDRERQLLLALEAGRLGTWQWDVTTDHVRWSDQLYDLFGFTEEQFTPTRAGFLAIIHPQDRGRVEEQIENVYTGTCKTYEMEFRVLRGDNGRIVWTFGRGVIERDVQNRPLSISAVASDITSRKEMELQLADRESHLRRVVDNMLGFVGVLSPDGTLIDANQTALIGGGLTREDVVNKKFWDCNWWNFESDTVEKLKASVDRASRGEVIRYDACVRMAGDTRMIIDFMIVPVRSEDGAITHLIPSGVDITERKNAENESRQRERHLNMALEAGRMGSWEWDVVADRITWSDRLYEIFGYRKDEFKGTAAGFLEIVLPKDRRIVQDVIESIMHSRSEREEFECRTVRKNDGRVILAQCHGIVDRDTQGNAIRVTGFAVDITERVKAEHAQRANEQRLKMALRAGGMAAWEWRPDKSIWTDALYDMLGLSNSEIASSEKFFDCVHPNDLPGLKKDWEKAISGEQPYNAEFRLIRPDGEIRWLAGAGEVERDEVGNVLRIYGLNWDITDRKTAEQRRTRAAELEHFLLEASTVLASSLDYSQTLASVTDLCVPTFADWAFIDLVDDDGTTRRVHVAHADPAAKDLAAQVAKFPAKPDFPNHPPARGLFGGQALLIREFSEEMLVKAAQNKEHEAVMREVAPKSFIVVPLRSRNRSLGALTLITAEAGRRYNKNDLKVAKELARQAATAVDNARLFHAAQQASIAKSEFLANMSHEIRTPMTAVLGYADLLRERVTDEESREYLQTMRRNGEFLLDIINDILDLSKIEAGKFEVAPEKFAPVELIEDVRAIMAVRAAENNLELDVEYLGQLPVEIESDPKRLKQILINLVGNAIKFTRQGRVRIEVRLLPDAQPRLQFTVSDTGIGMTPQQQRQLFRPFSQGDATVTREFGGTGLGLAISRRLAHLLGGDIVAKSVEGKGSEFTVTIAVGDISSDPLAQPKRSAATDESKPTAEAIKLNCHILVVDDRRDIRFLSKRILTKAGATVDEAEDGALAVDHVRGSLDMGKCPDLILLDMQMPNLDGYQTAKQLREMGYNEPIIALTADAMQGDMKRCIECGCNAYLSKPIDTTRLLELVRQFIAESQTR